MIKRECKKEGSITQCQIPFYENGLWAGTEFIKLIALVWFSIHIGIRLLGKIIK